MAEVYRSNLAELDPADKEKAADRFLDLLDQKCRFLAEMPLTGRLREDLARGLRSFPVRRYMIYYRQVSDGIEVVRVLSAYRDAETIFRDT